MVWYGSGRSDSDFLHAFVVVIRVLRERVWIMCTAISSPFPIFFGSACIKIKVTIKMSFAQVTFMGKPYKRRQRVYVCGDAIFNVSSSMPLVVRLAHYLVVCWMFSVVLTGDCFLG